MSNSSKIGRIDRRVPVPFQEVFVADVIGKGYNVSDSEQIKICSDAFLAASFKLDRKDREFVYGLADRFDSRKNYKSKNAMRLKGFGRTAMLELLAKLGIWLNAVE